MQLRLDFSSDIPCRKQPYLFSHYSIVSSQEMKLIKLLHTSRNTSSLPSSHLQVHFLSQPFIAWPFHCCSLCFLRWPLEARSSLDCPILLNSTSCKTVLMSPECQYVEVRRLTVHPYSR